jgi:hypothetical protein
MVRLVVTTPTLPPSLLQLMLPPQTLVPQQWQAILLQEVATVDLEAAVVAAMEVAAAPQQTLVKYKGNLVPPSPTRQRLQLLASWLSLSVLRLLSCAKDISTLYHSPIDS